MKERPIIMSAWSVPRLLDGSKTMTRRVVKPQPAGAWAAPGRRSCPYGVPGDLLWVRETWRYHDWDEDGLPWIEYRADGATLFRDCDAVPESWAERLTDEWARLSAPENYEIHGRAADQKWRSPRFMPKWAARLWLRVTDVRVERVQDISPQDVIAEGLHEIPGYDPETRAQLTNEGRRRVTQDAFRDLWDSLNAKRAPWDDNPWVWATSFERVDR